MMDKDSTWWRTRTSYAVIPISSQSLLIYASNRRGLGKTRHDRSSAIGATLSKKQQQVYALVQGVFGLHVQYLRPRTVWHFSAATNPTSKHHMMRISHDKNDSYALVEGSDTG
ncbi:MAG TPA: hypothetical protein VNI77_02080 [Nitrososphaera sp.]|nr:hypothetical protein [Nitrososphaera sp.]